jgi:hypothetical protein
MARRLAALRRWPSTEAGGAGRAFKGPSLSLGGRPLPISLRNHVPFIYQAKLFVEHLSGFSFDELHVLIGVGIHFLAAGLLRRPLSSWRPWLVVLGISLINEANDLIIEQWPNLAVQYGEGFKDILSTMIVPSALLLATRSWPTLFMAQGNRGSGRASGPVDT